VIPLILSSSSISSYLACHYRYFLAEVWRLPSQSSTAMAIGSAVHAGAEVRQNGGDLVDAFDIAAMELDEELPAEPDEPFDTIIGDAERMLRVYEEKVLPGRHATMIEEPITATINGIAFSGILDAADETIDTIWDLKTHSGRSPSFDPKPHVYQLTGYGILYEHRTSRAPQHYLIDLITRTGKYRQYEITPDRGEFIDVLGLVSRGILAGEFEPTGANAGRCKWCPYVMVCKYAKVDES